MCPSPKPSREDALSWGISFERVMKSAAGRNCFRQFLQTEFSEENMMFWLACEELKMETNKTVVEEKVRQIYEDFISILSPKEVRDVRQVSTPGSDPRMCTTQVLICGSYITRPQRIRNIICN